MASKEGTTNGGVGFFGLLGIVFIVLKLTHVIDWSWWWVLAPLWFPTVFFGGVALFAFVMYLLFQKGKR